MFKMNLPDIKLSTVHLLNYIIKDKTYVKITHIPDSKISKMIKYLYKKKIKVISNCPINLRLLKISHIDDYVFQIDDELYVVKNRRFKKWNLENYTVDLNFPVSHLDYFDNIKLEFNNKKEFSKFKLMYA